MPEKPKPKPTPKQGSARPSQSPSTQAAASDRTAVPALFSCANSIPLMFQAQTKKDPNRPDMPDRGNIQYVGDREDNTQPKYETWVKEWLEGCPPKPQSLPTQNLALQRQSAKPTIKLPSFGASVKTWEYQIRWRMITNGGQDGGLIRPVFGAKGIPFFPGSSMKGAFRNACPEAKRVRYCGGEAVDAEGNKRTNQAFYAFTVVILLGWIGHRHIAWWILPTGSNPIK